VAVVVGVVVFELKKSIRRTKSAEVGCSGRLVLKTPVLVYIALAAGEMVGTSLENRWR